jgi:hypothetical protein
MSCSLLFAADTLCCTDFQLSGWMRHGGKNPSRMRLKIADAISMFAKRLQTADIACHESRIVSDSYLVEKNKA